MKIVKLMPVGGNDSLYRFGLRVEGFIVKGFLYNAVTKQIRPPHYVNSKNALVPIVWAFGMKWKQLQLLIQFMLDKQYTMCDHRSMELELIEEARSGRA